jgi:hypothetical protein
LSNKYLEDNITLADVKLRGTLDLESTQWFGDYYSIKGTFDRESIPTEFIDQIKINPSGKFFEIHFNFKNEDYKVQDIYRIISNNTLYARLFTKDDGSVVANLTDFPMIYPNKKDMSFLNYDSVISTYGIIVKNGGFNFYKNTLESLSFSGIYNDINSGDPSVNYLTILEDGSYSYNDFVIGLEIPNLIAMPMYVTSTIDDNKPINFNFIDIIGYRLKLKDSIEIAPFYRHNGYFTPKFYNVFNFSDPYEQDSTIDPDYKNSILSFTKYLNTNISEVKDLKNKFYHKITNKTYSILELENNNLYKPLYPLINESAFERKDINIFKSNWNNDYYYNYVDKKSFEILNLKYEKENKCYFGSKYMKTEKTIFLEKDIPFTYENKDSNIVILLDFKTALLNYFLSNISNLYFSDITTKTNYINNNIIPVYEYSSINFYIKQNLNKNSVNFDNMYIDDASKISNGLNINKNFSITKKDSLTAEIDFKKMANAGYLIGISVNLKII